MPICKPKPEIGTQLSNSFRNKTHNIIPMNSNTKLKSNVNTKDSFQAKNFNIIKREEGNQQLVYRTKAQTVSEMLEARRQQPPKNSSGNVTCFNYYESIQERIKRQLIVQKSVNNKSGTTNAKTKNRSLSKNARLEIENRLISLMLESENSHGCRSTIERNNSINRNFKQNNLRNTSIKYQLNVANRNEEWLKKRNEKVSQMIEEKEQNKSFGCTFKPYFETKEYNSIYRKGLSECQSLNRSISSHRMSREEVNIIRNSNSYSQIYQIKRSISRENSRIQID